MSYPRRHPVLGAIPEEGALLRSEVRTMSQLNHARLFERKAALENDAFLEEILRTKVKLMDPRLTRAEAPRALVDEVVRDLKGKDEVLALLETRRTPGPEEGTRGAFAGKREMLRMALTTGGQLDEAARRVVAEMGGNADGPGRVLRTTRPSTTSALGRASSRDERGQAAPPTRKRLGQAVSDEVLPIMQNRVRSLLVADKRYLAALFSEFDTSDDGMLSASEFKQVMETFGVDCTDKDVNDMVRMYGSSGRKNKDGQPLMSHRDFYLDLIGLPSSVGSVNKFEKFTMPDEQELLRPDTAGLQAIQDTGSYITSKFRKAMYDVPWKLRREFEKFDTSKDGNITLEEFARVLQANLGTTLKETDQLALFHMFDKDKKGSVQFDEFVEALIGTPLRDPTKKSTDYGGQVSVFPEDKLDPAMRAAFTELKTSFEDKITGPRGFKKAFKAVDRDGSGDIDKYEFIEACGRLGMEMTPEEISSVFVLFDKDGSGRINYPEFLGCVAGVAPPPGSKSFVSNKLFHHRGRIAARDDDLREKIRKRLYGDESKISKLFSTFDVSGDGKMQFDEFRRMTKKLNLNMTVPQLKALYLSLAEADPASVKTPGGVKLFAISKNAFAKKIVGLNSAPGKRAIPPAKPQGGLFPTGSRPASRAGTRTSRTSRPASRAVTAPPASGGGVSDRIALTGTSRVATRPAAIQV